MLESQIIGELCAMYGIGQPITHSSNLRDESASQSHLVTSQGRYMLACLPEGYALHTLNCEHALIRYLERQGYPTPKILLTRYGTTAALANRRLYVLMEALVGQPYDAAQPAHLRAAANGLGAFHYLAQAYTGQPPQACLNGLEQPCEDAQATVDAILAVIGKQTPDGQVPHGRALVESVRAELQPLRQLLDGADTKPLLCTIIHGSYHPAALRYHNETLACVLEYQHAHWAARLIDVAHAINSFCSDSQPERGSALDLDRVQLFMEAYRERCAICYEETALLPLSIRADCVSIALDACAAFLTRRHTSITDLTRLLGRIVERLKWLDTHSDALVCVATSRKTSS